jgi:hypothetical protein
MNDTISSDIIDCKKEREINEKKKHEEGRENVKNEDT